MFGLADSFVKCWSVYVWYTRFALHNFLLKALVLLSVSSVKLRLNPRLQLYSFVQCRCQGSTVCSCCCYSFFSSLVFRLAL